MANLKISFFTTCGNRLTHLQKTLPANIESNLDYQNCEHIVLDYGSTDGIIDWVKEDLQEYLDTGRLKLYSYDADFFWHNHAKNLAAKHTSEDSDIICSIDSDNYTAESNEGECLASYLNKAFVSKEMFVRACGWDHAKELWANDRFERQGSLYSASGKFAFWRKEFFKMRGFNEFMKGHYYDEEEIWRRAEMCWGFNHVKLPVEYSQFINHSNYLRLNNLDPEIVDSDKLLETQNLEFALQNYMDDGAMDKYPQAAKNKEILTYILNDKIKVPNGKYWGTGKPRRIR